MVGRSDEVITEKMKPWSTALAPILQVQHQPLGHLWKATTLEIFPKTPTNSIAQTHIYGHYHKPTVIDKNMVLTATKDPGYAMSKVFVFLYFISACSLVESESV